MATPTLNGDTLDVVRALVQRDGLTAVLSALSCAIEEQSEDAEEYGRRLTARRLRDVLRNVDNAATLCRSLTI